jgi:hypothetical protein
MANGAEFDVADDSIWTPIRANLRAGLYQLFIWPPSCNTFQLGMHWGATIITRRFRQGQVWLRLLPWAQAAKVRLHNLLAIRTASAYQVMIKCGGIVVVEHPARTLACQCFIRQVRRSKLVHASAQVH